MRRAAEILAMLLTTSVFATQIAAAQTVQSPAAESSPAPAAPSQQLTTSSHSRYWFVGGVGFGAARSGCPDCPTDGVFSDGRSLLMDAGFRVNDRLDFGVEVSYGNSKFDDSKGEPIPTTFVLGVVQVRPWHTHGFFFKTGMGAGIVGSGLKNPFGVPVGSIYTTNTMALVYGAGWVFRREQRFALQVHGTHHVASLGEVNISEAESFKNVINNYWTVVMGIVFR